MAAGQRLSLADLDAFTLDAYGTLLRLRDPVSCVHRLVPEHERAEVERSFAAEAEFYAANSHRGRDPDSLAKLYEDCVAVFNRSLGSELIADDYVGALEYEWVDGALDAVEQLRARGLALAVVADWDISLVERLTSLRMPIVTSAEAGVPKPDPAPFRLALERLGVPPERAVHVGDQDKDRDGAASAGMRFASAPLAEAVAQWS